MTKVTIYTRPNCQPCRASKRWMTENGVHFEEESAEDPGNLSAIKYLGYAQAPVTIVTKDDGTEEHWSGFNPTALELHIGKRAA